MNKELAMKLSQDMAYVLLENPKINNGICECVREFVQCTGISNDRFSIEPSSQRITIKLNGKEYEYVTEGKSYIDVLKQVFYELYYLPVLS
ncbi:hypothetical protein MZI91_005123 [Escherichia coli]|nr:hypothetical protein [Escherichia coli]